jgi:4-alpha-glucanotransferase
MILKPERRIAGILAPLFALRGRHDLGIGDTAALRETIDWCAGSGFHLLQLLPINETGADNSPYNAISSVAIDPTTITLRPGEPLDLRREDYDEVLEAHDVEQLASGAVDYSKVKPLKRALLERAWLVFSQSRRGRTARVKKFGAFREENAGWLEPYTLFRALMDENETERWDEWPESQRSPAGAMEWLLAQTEGERAAFERKRDFFAYVQWIAYAQWRDVHDYASSKGVALMGDVPFGVSYHSSDVFAHTDLFDLEWSGGAPPERVFKSDPFTEKWGQNWGIPNYRWDVMRQDDFAWWRQRVRMVREMFHLFRIDHILGFYRIYSFPWRPDRNAEFLPLSEEEARTRTGGRLPHFRMHDDSSAENREANRKQGEEILRVLLEETGEYRLIGEDLGVVPDYVRPNLTSLGIAGFKVPQWEYAGDGGLIDGRNYAALSVTTYATHDHPPMATAWNAMIADMQGGGEEAHRARWLFGALSKFAGLPAGCDRLYDDEIREGLLRGLFCSNAWIAIAMITDLFGSEQRFNVPGAVATTNWSARLPGSPRDWRRDPELKRKMKRLRDVLAGCGRLGEVGI